MSSSIPSGTFRPPTIRQTLVPHKARQDIRNRVDRIMGWDVQPTAPDAPPPPVIEDTEARRQDEADRLRRRRGRASAVVNDGSTPMTASKVLLGQ